MAIIEVKKRPRGRKVVTFCIAVYDDLQMLKDTLKSLLESVDINKILINIVDDSSTIDDNEFSHIPEVTLFHNKKRIGVGASLDKAVAMATTDIVFPMGCDIRFTRKGWMKKFIQVINDNPVSLVSTVTAGLNLKRLQIVGKENHYHASHILFHVSTKNNNKPALPFREYIESKWNKKFDQKNGTIQIGCILGAFYGCKRDWYQSISGFSHHREWGSLEPLISLRSYIAGGNCILDLDTITGHVFKSASSTKQVRNLVYNKLLIASTLLPKKMEDEVFEWAKKISDGKLAIKMWESDAEIIKELQKKGRDSLSEKELLKRIEPTGILDG